MDDEDKREKPKREGSEERVDDDDDDESEENKNLRDLILEQLASLEQSDVSDDGSYKVRLSCILEDDESESSGALKRAETDNKPNEEGILENRSIGLRSTGDADEAETGGKSGSETVRVTNLDDSVAADDASQEKTEERHKESEESDEIDVEPNAYQLKKLKSSDDLQKKPFFVRRREPSSDSSDLDISITNSTNGTIGDVKVEKVAVDEEKGGDKTLTELAEDKTKRSTQNPSTDERVQESERSEIKIEEDVGEPKTKNRIEVLDNETISSIFAKVSKAYLEKTKGPVKWEENERVDRPITPMRSERSRSRERPEDQISIQDAHIRGTSPKVYNPPVPPETYLWEELKRLRERGGYPWTYLDKPPFDEASWKKYMEHVYEPINPPSSSSEKNLSKEELTNMAAPSLKVPSIPDSDKQFVETELVKKDLGVVEESKKLSSEEMDKAYEEQEPLHESLGTAVQSVDQTTTVTAMPTTVTATPTTGPTSLKKTLSTPKFDGTKLKDTTSKFFKDIPVKCATFEKTRRQQIRAQAHEIQEKLRNQAGRIRTRLNEKKEEGPVRKAKEVEGGAIRFKLPEVHAPKIWPLPTKFNLTDKPKLHFQESAKLHLPHSSKFHLPERKNFNLAGKIRLPEKKNFHLPDRAHLHMPKRPKLHLPERAKFHLPDKAKFHLPEKAKFHLPEGAKLHLPEKAKFHFPEGAKFHLPDKSKFHIPEGAKFHLPEKTKIYFTEKAKFHLPERPKFNLPEKAKIIRNKVETLKLKKNKNFQMSSSAPSTPEPEPKNYSKLFPKHSKDYITSSPKQIRNQSVPLDTEPIKTSKSDAKSRWLESIEKDIQYADDNGEDSLKDANYQRDESLMEYVEKDFEFLEEYRPQSRRSTMPEIITGNAPDQDKDKRRKGVLEEINSDEFFLRQKGISQDDIELGNYLTREIREAFRSSGVNALAKMDYFGIENVDPVWAADRPVRPARTHSVKKKKKQSILKPYVSDPYLIKESYETYPPRRPKRKSKFQSKTYFNEEPTGSERIARMTPELSKSSFYDDDNDEDEDETNLSKYDNLMDDENDVSEYYKSPKPPREYEHYKVPKTHKMTLSLSPPTPPTPPTKRKSYSGNKFSERGFPGAWNDTDTMGEPPVPMARKRNKKKKRKEEATMERLLQNEQLVQEIAKDSTEIVGQFRESSVPSLGSQIPSSLGSKNFVTEEEVSCSFQSEFEPERPDNEMIVDDVQPLFESSRIDPSEPETSNDQRREISDVNEVGFGYATVGKPTVTKPPRQKKKHKFEKVLSPKRKKEVSVPVYGTYPKRTPVRPLRNYSTLRPSRPPRRNQLASTTRAQFFSTYSEIKNDNLPNSNEEVKVSGTSKDLQTEKIFEKMKGRPLPPPPRPIRNKSKGPDELPVTKPAISLPNFKEDVSEKQISIFVNEPPCTSQSLADFGTSVRSEVPSDTSSFQLDAEGGNVIEEFSPEQLRIQQIFLDKMKEDVSQLKLGGHDKDDLEDAELKAEVIRQIEDIIAEEKRILDEGKKNESATAFRETQTESPSDDLMRSLSRDGETKRSCLEPDIDMGYSSLDRRGHRQEQSPSDVPPQLPPKMGKLQVRELEADTISVNEVQANQIFVKELQSNRLASQEIDNTGGNVALGNVNLSPSLIDQIVAKIPWETLRESQERAQSRHQSSRETSRSVHPVRPQRRHRRGFQELEDTDEDSYSQPSRRTHKKHQRQQYASDEDDEWERRVQTFKTTEPETTGNLTELSIQLARACTAAGLDTFRNFVRANSDYVRTLDKEICVQIVLCIAVALVAAFFLFGYDAKIVHINRMVFKVRVTILALLTTIYNSKKE